MILQKKSNSHYLLTSNFLTILILLFSSIVSPLTAQKNLGFKNKSEQLVDINELEVFSNEFFKARNLVSHVLIVLIKEDSKFVKSYPEHSNDFSELTRFNTRVLNEVFTTFSILQLQELEKINTRGDIYNYKFKYGKNFKQNILVENLLTHTTGIQENIIYSTLDKLRDQEYFKLNPPIRFSEPNELIGYNADNLIILKSIINEASGKEANSYIKESILDKLTLENTSFEEMKLYSNGKEIMKMVTFLANIDLLESMGILKKDTWKESIQERIRLEDKLPGSVIGFFEHFENNIWGYSRINETNFTTEELILFPDKKSALYFYSDSYNPNLRREFLAEFLDKFFEVEKIKVKRDKSPGYAEYLENFEGEYAASQISTENIAKFRMYSSAIQITKDNGMLLLDSGNIEPYGDLDGHIEFIETEPFLFRSPDREIYISFKMNEAGNVEYLLSGSGQHGSYRKLSLIETKAFHENLVIFFLGFYCIILILLAIEIPYLYAKKIAYVPNRIRRNIQVFLWLESILALILFSGFYYFIKEYNLMNTYSYIIEGNPYDYFLFSIPFVFIIGLSLLTYYALRSFLERGQHLYRKLQVGMFLIVSLAFVYWMSYWNLLSFAF